MLLQLFDFIRKLVALWLTTFVFNSEFKTSHATPEELVSKLVAMSLVIHLPSFSTLTIPEWDCILHSCLLSFCCKVLIFLLSIAFVGEDCRGGGAELMVEQLESRR